MPEGIVEELFIAPVPATGVSEVWFRNWSVVANLGLRAAGTLAEDPESVVWGQTKDKFVVRTGIFPGEQTYYLFHIPRSIGTIFGDGVIPTVVLDRVLSPFNSALTLLVLNATKTSIFHVQDVHVTTRWNARVFHTAACRPNGFNSGTVDSTSDLSTTTPTTGSVTVTLGNVLVDEAATTVTYGLNHAGDLVLLVNGSVSISSGGLPVLPEGGRHVFIIRFPGLLGTEEVLFRTTLAQKALTQTTRSTGLSPWNISANQKERYVIPGGAVPCAGGLDLETFPIGALSLGSTSGGGSPITTIPFNTGIMIQTGISAQDVSPLANLPFITGNTYTPASSDANQSASRGGSELIPNGPLATIQYAYEYTATWVERTWTLGGTVTYSVLFAYPLQLTAPINFLLVVARVTGGISQTGLFLKTDVGWKTIREFTENPAGFVTLKVMTANERHALWYVEANSSTVYLTDLKNNRTRAVGTNLTQIRNYRFRLLQGDLANPVDLLWQGAEPAGRFLEGWETDGTPTLTDTGEGFPLSLLDPYSDLADLPNGITPPVIPVG